MSNLVRFAASPCARSLAMQWQRPAATALWNNQVRQGEKRHFTFSPHVDFFFGGGVTLFSLT